MRTLGYHDGCAEDFVFRGNYFTEEEQDKLNDDYEAQLESDNWQGRYEWPQNKVMKV